MNKQSEFKKRFVKASGVIVLVSLLFAIYFGMQIDDSRAAIVPAAMLTIALLVFVCFSFIFIFYMDCLVVDKKVKSNEELEKENDSNK